MVGVEAFLEIRAEAAAGAGGDSGAAEQCHTEGREVPAVADRALIERADMHERTRIVAVHQRQHVADRARVDFGLTFLTEAHAIGRRPMDVQQEVLDIGDHAGNVGGRVGEKRVQRTWIGHARGRCVEAGDFRWQRHLLVPFALTLAQDRGACLTGLAVSRDNRALGRSGSPWPRALR